IRPGDTIGVLMPNGFDWVSAVYGSFLIGARPILLSVFSSPPEQEAALRTTGAATLLMSARAGHRDLLAGLRGHLPSLFSDRPRDASPGCERSIHSTPRRRVAPCDRSKR